MTGIPSSEILWTTIKTINGDTYYITSKEIRDYYYLYKKEGNKAVKINKNKDPLELENKYIKEI